MPFIQTSDNHLSPYIWADRPTIYGDAYRSFTQIVDYAVKTRYPLFLLGDVIDKRRPDATTVDFICEQMQRCQAADVPVFYTQGQHELDRTTPWLSVHPWPQHIHKKSILVDGMEIYGLDWLPRDELLQALAEMPPSRTVLMCHQVWREFMGNIGQQDGSMTEIPHVRYVLTGDYHDTKIGNVIGASGQQITYVSAGATKLCAIDQPVNKVFLEVANVDGALQFTPVPLRTRQLINRTIYSAQDLESTVAWFNAWAQTNNRPDAQYDQSLAPLVRLTYREDVPDLVQRITAVAGAAEIFFEPIPVVDNKPIDIREHMGTGTVTLGQALMELAADRPVLLNAVQQLLTSPDAAGEWDRQYQQFMATQ